MNERDLFRAIGDVSDDLIEEAGSTPRKSHLRIYLSTAVAACLCIVVLTVAGGLFASKSADKDTADHAQRYCVSENMAAAPKESANPADGLFSSSCTPTDAEVVSQSETPAYSYDAMPQDFSFHLLWNGQEYDSSTRIFTDSSGNTVPLSLEQSELEQIWMLLSGLELPETTPEYGDIYIDFTCNAEVFQMVLSKSDTGAPLSICQALIRIVEAAAQRAVS